MSTKKKRRWKWWILLAVIAALALRFGWWGRPIGPRFTVGPAPSDSGYQWQIDDLGFMSFGMWRTNDHNGDGAYDEFWTPKREEIFFRPGFKAPPKRWLVICLDGVPLEVMQRMWDRGHFREFYRPTAVVSTYPSDSETALTDVLHAPPVPGYEQLYFDRAQNRIRGGWWVTLSGYHIPYIKRLDYDTPGWAKALPYLAPWKSYYADLGRLSDRYGKERDQPVFLAHLAVSDAMFHLFTAEQLEPALKAFEDVVRSIYLEGKGELGVLLFSDHGNSQVPSRPAPINEHLERRGWRVRGSIEGVRDVAMPDYGLIGMAAVYCKPEAIEELAGTLVETAGVDLVVFADSARGGATIRSAAGRGHLRWSDDGSRNWYEATGQDPLELLAVFERLRAEGRLSADGSASDADLFAATAGSWYPDPAARIRNWALNHVQNRADILVSLKPGYFHGASVFTHIVDFVGTHGAMESASTLGFAMGTHTLPTAQRLANLLPEEFMKTEKRK